MRHVLALMGLAAVFVGELSAPPTAAACSCLVTPIYRSDPFDSAGDVPLNQAILIEGVFDPTSVRLEDERGNAVEFELNAGPWPGCEGTSADVIPKAPLAPNARYTIRVEPLYSSALGPEDRRSLEFTTGTSMLPDEELEPPRATASVLFNGPESMCGIDITEYTCLGIEDSKNVELILRRGDEVLMRTTTLVLDDATYGTSQIPDCVELRRRAPTGKRSAPLKICGEALRPRAWDKSESTQTWVRCENGSIGQAKSPFIGGAPNPDPAAAGSPNISEAGGRAPEGGAKADAGSRPRSASDVDHRAYGCAAISGDPSGAGLFASLALALCARRRSRG